ncbi:MAG: hypothetical protein ACE5K8_05635 [Candidatus Zixiibacteriota bacterium]
MSTCVIFGGVGFIDTQLARHFHLTGRFTYAYLTAINNRGVGFRDEREVLIVDESGMSADHGHRPLMNPWKRGWAVTSAQEFLKSNYEQKKLIDHCWAPVLGGVNR